MPRTALGAVRDYYYHFINRAINRAVVFWIGRLDEQMAAFVNLDAILRPIGRPQTLEEMQNAPALSPRDSQVAELRAVRIVVRESGEPWEAYLQHAGNGAWCHL